MVNSDSEYSRRVRTREQDDRRRTTAAFGPTRNRPKRGERMRTRGSLCACAHPLCVPAGCSRHLPVLPPSRRRRHSRVYFNTAAAMILRTGILRVLFRRQSRARISLPSRSGDATARRGDPTLVIGIAWVSAVPRVAKLVSAMQFY